MWAACWPAQHPHRTFCQICHIAVARTIGCSFSCPLSTTQKPGASPVKAAKPATSKPTKEDALKRIEEIKLSHPNNLAVKNFDSKYYDSLNEADQTALLQCMASGIMNEDSGMGCYAMQVGSSPVRETCTP